MVAPPPGDIWKRQVVLDLFRKPAEIAEQRDPHPGGGRSVAMPPATTRFAQEN
jgi:hypothetical protein